MQEQTFNCSFRIDFFPTIPLLLCHRNTHDPSITIILESGSLLKFLDRLQQFRLLK